MKKRFPPRKRNKCAKNKAKKIAKIRKKWRTSPHGSKLPRGIRRTAA